MIGIWTFFGKSKKKKKRKLSSSHLRKVYIKFNKFHINAFLVLTSIGKSQLLLIPQPIESSALIHALSNIMYRFYFKQTTTIFIMEPSTSDIVDAMIKSQHDQTVIAYVIESQITVNHNIVYRTFNIFLIDSYESFR